MDKDDWKELGISGLKWKENASLEDGSARGGCRVGALRGAVEGDTGHMAHMPCVTPNRGATRDELAQRSLTRNGSRDACREVSTCGDHYH